MFSMKRIRRTRGKPRRADAHVVLTLKLVRERANSEIQACREE
jgi:hypothetical protein